MERGMWGIVWRILAVITCLVVIASWLESRPWVSPDIRAMLQSDPYTLQALVALTVVAVAVFWLLKLEKQEEGQKSANSLRELLRVKLARARTALEDFRRPGVEIASREWQGGYVKALEEILDPEGFSLRRHLRRPTAISTEIARMLPEEGAPGARGQGTIVDLSAGGCNVVTAMEVSKGEVIELSFTRPTSRMPITLKGWVRRSQKADGQSRVGVEFKSEFPISGFGPV